MDMGWEERKISSVEKEIEEKISHYYEIEAQGLEVLGITEAILEMAKNPLDYIKVDAQGFIGQIIFKKVNKLMDYLRINNYGHASINTEEAFKSLSEKARDRLNVLENNLEDFFNNDRNRLLTGLFFEEFLTREYGGIPLIDAILMYIDKLEGIEGKLQTYLGTSVSPFSDFKGLKQRVMNGEWTRVELEMLMDDGFIAEILEMSFSYQDRYGNEIAEEIRENLTNEFRHKTLEPGHRFLGPSGWRRR